MNWQQARVLLLANIIVGMRLDHRVRFKIVTQVPPYASGMRMFIGNPSFRVQIGQNNFIDVPIIVLQNLFRESTLYYNRIFDRNLFAGVYPTLERNRPCYFHTIGKLFEMAGVAIQVNQSEYYFI